MADVVVTVEGFPSPVDGKAVEPFVDADISAFDDFFDTLGTGRMTPGEKSIIKTYLAYKLGIKKAG